MRLHRLNALILLFWAVLAVGLWSRADTPEPALDRSEPAGRRLSPAAQAKLDARKNLVVLAVERVRGAVVNIHSERTVNGPPSAEVFANGASLNRVNGMGTGIIIDPRGYIVTNQHVVEDVSTIRVRLTDGTTLGATLVGRSAGNDLAILKIDARRPLPTMPLGTASDLMVGETVMAIGNAYGYEHTVSQGIVSAVKRDVTLNKEITYRSLIQTDAAINPGNSGGPLVNIHGELVGVNVAIRAGAQNIGFAIPVDNMIRIVSDLLRARRTQKASDGIVCHDQLLQTEEGVQRTVFVDRVENNSPAATAGVKAGDVLVKVADLGIVCGYDVDRALLDRSAGEKVTVVVRRQGKDVPLQLALRGEQAKPGAADLIWRKLGVRVAAVSPEMVRRVNPQLNGGVEVATVSPEGAAARAGIRAGDILVGLHQWETLSLDNVVFVLSHSDLASFNPLSFYIVRGAEVRHGFMQQVE
jgi:serine protease Do